KSAAPHRDAAQAELVARVGRRHQLDLPWRRRCGEERVERAHHLDGKALHAGHLLREESTIDAEMARSHRGGAKFKRRANARAVNRQSTLTLRWWAIATTGRRR